MYLVGVINGWDGMGWVLVGLSGERMCNYSLLTAGGREYRGIMAVLRLQVTSAKSA